MIQQDVSLKLPSNALTYGILQSLVLPVFLTIFAKFIPQTAGYYILIGIVLLILSIVYAFIYFSTFSYVVNKESIIINSGVIFKSSKTVNYNDLQNIQVNRGPILMMLGLASLQGFTSSPAQLVISGDGRTTRTTIKPDVEIILTLEDANELSQMMRVGDIQKVAQI
jgi:uncharacterized membrane protein YdbT with pleckstrin-like domain